MNDEKYYMIDIKINRYAWSHHSQYDAQLQIEYRDEDNFSIENMHCDKKIKESIQEIIKIELEDKLKELI